MDAVTIIEELARLNVDDMVQNVIYVMKMIWIKCHVYIHIKGKSSPPDIQLLIPEAGLGPDDPRHVLGLLFMSANGATVLHSQRKTSYTAKWSLVVSQQQAAFGRRYVGPGSRTFLCPPLLYTQLAMEQLILQLSPTDRTALSKCRPALAQRTAPSVPMSRPDWIIQHHLARPREPTQSSHHAAPQIAHVPC